MCLTRLRRSGVRGGSKNRVTSVRSEVNSVGSTSSPRGISPLSPLLFSLLTTFPLTFSRWLLTRLPRAIIRVRIAHALNDGNGRKNVRDEVRSSSVNSVNVEEMKYRCCHFFRCSAELSSTILFLLTIFLR